MRRLLLRLWSKTELWQRALVFALVPVVFINVSVATLGRSAVFPLSPFFLKEKVQALGEYVSHLPRCVWNGHPDREALIREAEQRHRLPRGLFRAVVEVESEGRPHRISPAGAMGMSQLMPGTAKQLKVEDPFDSRQAIDGGARYLAQNYRRMKNVRLAVAAYNAGPGNVTRGVPRNGETEFYVEKVMRAYQRKPVAHGRR